MATQGSEANAKDDTLYYAFDRGAGIADLAADLSQRADDQAIGATWTFESSPAPRFDVNAPWTVEVDCDISTATTGRICTNSVLSIRVGSVAGTVDAILVTSAGTVSVIALPLPGVTGSNQRFVVAWAVEANPITTGATDAIRSEMRVWNIATGAYSQIVSTHRDRTAIATGAWIWWASTTGGGNPFTGTPRACRFSAGRFRTATETHEDFVAATTPPTFTRATRLEVSLPETAHELTDAGQFVGPIPALVAANVTQNDLRLASPIVNHSLRSRPDYEDDVAPAPSAWLRDAIDTDYTLLGAYTYCRPMPSNISRVRCRVHAQHYESSAGPDATVHLRVWSMNRPLAPVPAAVTDSGQALISYVTDDATISTITTSGTNNGEWLDLGELPVARNAAGESWFVLAAWVENPHATVRWRVKAITIDPIL